MEIGFRQSIPNQITEALTREMQYSDWRKAVLPLDLIEYEIGVILMLLE